MLGLGFLRHRKSPWKFLTSYLFSFVYTLNFQFALTLIPRYFSSYSLLVKLSFSVIILLVISVLGKGCKRLLRISSSAPAFVFFNICFIWAIHLTIIRKAIPFLWSIVFDVECLLLLIGFFNILSSDPGVVLRHDEGAMEADSCLEQPTVHMEEVCDVRPLSGMDTGSLDMVCDVRLLSRVPLSSRRIRFCKFCKAHVKGFDHHCPAFGNCIGQKNHILFMVLLVGFVMVETSYTICSDRFIKKSLIANKAMLENSLSGNLAISTTLFSLLQVLWQVLFLIWHTYCICFNIKTDEWIHWRKYPQFHVPAQPQPGRSYLETQYVNPYNMGIWGNIKEFLSPQK